MHHSRVVLMKSRAIATWSQQSSSSSSSSRRRSPYDSLEHKKNASNNGGKSIIITTTTTSVTTTKRYYSRRRTTSSRSTTTGSSSGNCSSSPLYILQVLVALLVILQQQQRFCNAGVLSKVPPQSCTQCTLFDYRSETCVPVTSYTDPLNHCPPICESETVCGPDGHCVLNVIPQCDCDFLTGQCNGASTATNEELKEEVTPRTILYTESQHNQHLQALYTIGSCLVVVLAVFTILIGTVLWQRKHSVVNTQYRHHSISGDATLSLQQLYDHLSSSKPSPKSTTATTATESSNTGSLLKAAEQV